MPVGPVNLYRPGSDQTPPPKKYVTELRSNEPPLALLLSAGQTKHTFLLRNYSLLYGNSAEPSTLVSEVYYKEAKKPCENNPVFFFLFF